MASSKLKQLPVQRQAQNTKKVISPNVDFLEQTDSVLETPETSLLAKYSASPAARQNQILALQQQRGNSYVQRLLATRPQILPESGATINRATATATEDKETAASRADNSIEAIAQELTGVFESQGSSSLTIGDDGWISLGKNQATLAAGNLQNALEIYIELAKQSSLPEVKERGVQMESFREKYEAATKEKKKDNPAEVQLLIDELMGVEVVEESSTEKTGQAKTTKKPKKSKKPKKRYTDTPFKSLLELAQHDKEMEQALNQVFREKYWLPAKKTATDIGIATPLGYAMLYDTKIHGGLNPDVKATRIKLGANPQEREVGKGKRKRKIEILVGGKVGDINPADGETITESLWLNTFNQCRKERLLSSAAEKKQSSDAKTRRTGEANERAANERRIPSWQTLLDEENFQLDGSITLSGAGTHKPIAGLAPQATLDSVAEASAENTVAVAGSGSKLQPAPVVSPATTAKPAKADSVLKYQPETGLYNLVTLPVMHALSLGEQDENKLTNEAFYFYHPELKGKGKLAAANPLTREWVNLRNYIVRPLLQKSKQASWKIPSETAAAQPTKLAAKPAATNKPTTAETMFKAAGIIKTPGRQGNKKLIEGYSLTDEERASKSPDNLVKMKFEIERTLTKALGEKDGNEAVSQWFADIVTDATFLGVKIRNGLHKELLEKLQQAEAIVANKPQIAALGCTSPAELGKKLGLHDAGGLREPRAADGNTPSFHSYGLAIDLNPASNPWVRYTGARIVENATELLLGKKVTIDNKTDWILSDPDKASEAWETLHEASEAVKEYLALRNNPEAVATKLAAQGKPTDSKTIEATLKMIGQDYKLSLPTKGKKPLGTDAAKNGIMTLNKYLVEGLVEAGLSWGGLFGGGRDIMHFDLDNGTVKSKKRRPH